MKKFLSGLIVVLVVVAIIFSVLAFSPKTQFVANAIDSAKTEEFGFCVSKNASKKQEIISAMNKVILSADIQGAVDYYNAIAMGQAPSNEIQQADLSSCTGGTLNVYTCSGFEPYEFLNAQGEIIGVDIWLMSYVCKELNLKMQVTDMDFDGIVSKVATEDNAVGAAGITIDEDRKKTVEFSLPYYSSKQYIVSAKDKGYSAIAQLTGLCVGVQKGTTGAIMMHNAASEYNITVKEYNTGAEALSAAKAGKCDAIVADALPAIKLASSSSNGIKEIFYDTLIKDDQWKWYLQGIEITLLISLGAVGIGCAIGLVISLIKFYNKKYGKLKICTKVCDVYLTAIRGTPVYLQLLIMAFIVLASAQEIWVAILTFGINSGAYVAEIMRAGLEGVDHGQIEAGSSLGLSKAVVFKDIIFPQAIRSALPPLCNEFIALIKETSIVGVIGLIDITKVASRIVTKTYEPFLPYIVSAFIYLAVVVGLTYLLKLLEGRLAKSDRK